MSDLTDPTPRSIGRIRNPFVWPVQRAIVCPKVFPPSGPQFSDVIEKRRSGRQMSRLSMSEIVNTVAYVSVPRFQKDGDLAHRTLRPSISAGALHPVSVILVDGRQKSRAFRYDPLTHCLQLLIASSSDLTSLAKKAETLVPDARGTMLVFLAEKSRTEAWYESGSSLYWRDAGALMQSIALTAAAFDQAFCPLGILGNEVADSLCGDGDLIPCGVAMLGRMVSG